MRGFIEIGVNVDLEAGSPQRELVNVTHIIRVKEVELGRGRKKFSRLTICDGERTRDVAAVQSYEELMGLIERAQTLPLESKIEEALDEVLDRA